MLPAGQRLEEAVGRTHGHAVSVPSGGVRRPRTSRVKRRITRGALRRVGGWVTDRPSAFPFCRKYAELDTRSPPPLLRCVRRFFAFRAIGGECRSGQEDSNLALRGLSDLLRGQA